MPTRETFVVALAFAVVVAVAILGGALLLRSRRRRDQSAEAAWYPSAAAVRSDNNWLVSKNGRQFGPVTFDHLISYVQEGLLTRSDLLMRAGSQAWTRAEEVHGLFPSPPLPTAPAARRPADIALSVHDRVAGPWVHEHEALQHVTADALRHAAGRDPDPFRSTPQRATKEPRRNYFARHWRGELSLPVSYWVNGILAGLAAVLIAAAINASVNFKDDFQPGLALAAEILIWATTSLIALWRLVGIWRSATNYQRALKIFWGTVAKVLVVIGVVEALANLALVGAPQIYELYKIFRGDEAIGGYAFRVLRDGRELEFSGGITFGAAKDFQRFVDAMPAVQIVHLNSPGGRIAEAVRIGRLISARKLSTYVVGDCLSACTTIFLSGRERLISAQGRLGFHQPDFPGLSGEERRDLIANEELRLRQLGVSADFAHKANLAPPDNMWFPRVAELIAEHVATRVVNPLDFALSDVDVTDLTREGIRRQLLDDPMYAQIRKYFPDHYSNIVDTFEDGFKRGASGTELLEALKTPVTSAFFAMLPYASDEDVLAVMRFFVTNGSKMRATDPSDCYYAVRPAEASKPMLDRLRQRYPSQEDDEWAMRRRVIENFKGGNVRIPDEQEMLPLKKKLQAAIRMRFGNDADLISSNTIPFEKHSALCSVTIGYFEEMLKLPRKDAVAYFRYLRAHT
jgi:GYF domain 2